MPYLVFAPQACIGSKTIGSRKLSIRAAMVGGRTDAGSAVRVLDARGAGLAFPAPASSPFLNNRVIPINAARITIRSIIVFFKGLASRV